MSDEKPSWHLKEGDEIVPGRFALKKLGGGSAYEAYVAWDERLGYPVVAKCLRPHLVEDRPHLDALAREAAMLDQLDHPVILRSFGAVLDGERPHLVLEHLEGETLRHLIKYGPVAVEQLVPLALSLCSAIHYLRSEGIIHLDIKSRNIVMGVPPRLIDFSVARTVERAPKITGHVGTDAYMAPEQCDPQNRGPITPAADVWGLGAALYRAANGYVPFPRPKDYNREVLAERFPQLHSEPQPFIKGVPLQVRDVIMECLNPVADQRPAAMEVAAALEETVAAIPRRPVLRRFRPRHR